MKTINKVINPCFVNLGTQNRARVFIKIETNQNMNGVYQRNDLSITGVIGPHRGGNARGGCGQINMDFRGKRKCFNSNDIFYMPRWNSQMFDQLLDIWELYHMKNEVPEDVIAWLDSLPETTVTPAWI